MSWYWDMYQTIKQSGIKSDYQYKVLETTPILHSPDVLETMYQNANHEQKASIMLHIDNFSDITFNLDRYVNLRNKIWDDYT